jgi:predicted DNA-binding transcriptional regulator AlpA
MANISINSPLARARTLSGHTVGRPSDAAAVLGITREHLHTLSKMPGFPSKVVMGKRAVGWRISDLEAWIDSKAEGGV